jgi:hypothetical protein
MIFFTRTICQEIQERTDADAAVLRDIILKSSPGKMEIRQRIERKEVVPDK